jgi:transketolase
MFASGRNFEQIRNSIGYPHLNVKIGATHAGITVGEDGASHQCFEDLALMRTIPGMTVVCPSDDVETKAAVKAALDMQGPFYMRTSRAATKVINDVHGYKFELGKGILMKEGKDITIIATGIEVGYALEAAESLENDGVSVRVINIHTIKPIDSEIIIKAAEETDKLFTVEEHSIIGGLGSAVAEVLVENSPKGLTRIGVRDTYGESGPAKELLHKYKLDADGIYEQIKEKL